MSLKIKLSIVFVITLSFSSFAQILNQVEKSVFDDVVYYTAFSKQPTIVKWVQPVRYFVKGEQDPYFLKEIAAIYTQLAEITSLDIKKAETEDEANIIVELGKNNGEKDIAKPNGGRFVFQGNFNHKENEKSELTRIETLFMISASKTREDARYQLIRILLQSLGLFKKSQEDEYSLFYFRTNNTLKIGKSDTKIIKVFYAKEIKPGMTKAQVDHLLGIN